MSSLLESLTSPGDLGKLSVSDLNELAADIRKTIINTVENTGGHLASNLGAVELTIALHYCFDFLKDRLVFDVGHQAYAHKLLTGRFPRFNTLRLKGGLSGFPVPEESPYDVFHVGHASTSISQALGLTCGYEITSEDRHVIALIGDGALTGGMAFEGLNQAGHLKKNMLVILNDNEMAISPTVGAMANYFSRIRSKKIYHEIKDDVKYVLERIPHIGKSVEEGAHRVVEAFRNIMIPGQIFTELGFDYRGPIDGHNIDLLIETITNLKTCKGPVLLHVLTKKGKGHREAVEKPDKYHGVSPSLDTPDNVRKSGPVSYSEAFSSALIELGEENKNVAAITAAMPGGTQLELFGSKFPDRYFDVGICEQHAVGFAEGLASAGMKPVLVVYSTFLQRAYDQIFQELCLQKELHAVLVLDRGGLVAADGPTHHGVFDIAYLRHLPGINLMAPKDHTELRRMLDFAITQDATFAIRYPREKVPEESFFTKYEPLEMGKAEQLTDGEDVAVFAYGAMVERGYKAVQELSSDGIHAALYNARFAKPLDEECLLKAVEKKDLLVTVEDHVLAGGFGSAVCEVLAEHCCFPKRIVRLGVPDRFIEHGSREEVMAELGLDSASIARRIKQELDACLK